MGWTIDLPTTFYVAHEQPSHFDPRTFIRAGSDDFQNLVNELRAHKQIALDTETTGLVKWKDVPLYWSLAFGQKRMTLHGGVLPMFMEVFNDPSKEWIFANAKYDAHILANVGITIAGRLSDTQAMHALLYEEKDHGLKEMAEHLFGMHWGSFEDLFGKIGKKQSAEDRIRVAERENMGMLVEYASNDAWGTLAIYQQLRKELEAAQTHSLFWNKHPFIETLWDYFWKIEGKYTKVLWKMERRGIRVDVERFDKIKPEAEAELLRISQEISKRIGYVFNPNSTDQKVDYFFNQQGIKPTKLTKGGKSGVRKPSIDAGVLETLAGQHPVAQLMLEYSERSKLLGTYINGLREHCDPYGRIHTKFNQFPRTGRLSSSDPNLQNIPKPENDKWNLRSAFIPEKGKKLLVADYEQLEMRLLAAASLEQDMIDIFRRGEDVHMGNAALIFNLPYSDIELGRKIEKETKSRKRPESDLNDYYKKCLEARSAAKTIGFGLVYGMGPNKLANDLKCSLQEAKDKTAAFMARYPAVATFLEECKYETLQTGYAYTVLGRRRGIPELQSYRRNEQSKGERLAINTPIQGSAADIVKMAQINIDDLQFDKYFGYEMLLQVHDEVVGEVPEEYVDRAKKELREALEHPFIEDLKVHTAVDMGHGDSWAQAK
jgi:DNA polymerase-1